MATKYELATELRQLTRGTKTGPICRMKKHELEAEIDRIKLMKQLKDDIGEYPAAKPGPTGPRRIPTETVVSFGDEEEVKIKVPQAPAAKVVEPARRKPGRPPKAPEAVAPSPAPRLPVSAAAHVCNCAFCPKRSVVSFKGPTTLTM